MKKKSPLIIISIIILVIGGIYLLVTTNKEDSSSRNENNNTNISEEGNVEEEKEPGPEYMTAEEKEGAGLPEFVDAIVKSRDENGQVIEYEVDYSIKEPKDENVE
jgi:hypothetical protein